MEMEKFVRDSLAGMRVVLGLVVGFRKGIAAALAWFLTVRTSAGENPSIEQAAWKCFPTGLPSGESVQVRAAGFGQPACGLIHRGPGKVLRPMSPGGVATGYRDGETHGTFGLCCLFIPAVLVRRPLRVSFLGLSVEGRACFPSTGYPALAISSTVRRRCNALAFLPSAVR